MQRLQLRENHIFLALTIIIGILAGLAAVLFTLAIKGTTYLLFGIAPSHRRYILIPTLVSLLTGFLLKKFFPEARGSGVPQTEAAYHLQQEGLSARVAFGKFLTGVLCIGSGHSMGREGPSVQIGASIASAIGKWFRLSPARAKSLIPVASAAALSAAFNTPVAAVLFGLEEIIGDMNATLLGSAVVASVASVIVERSILGNSPIFHVPEYHLADPAELIAYVVLGVVGGLVSLAFCKGLLQSRAAFLRLPMRTRIFQPAMGGLIIGVILIFFPQVLGVGYEYADQALNGGLLFLNDVASVRREIGRDNRFVRVGECRRHFCAESLSRRDGRGYYRRARAPVCPVSHRQIPGPMPWWVWVRCLRESSGSDDICVHDLRTHSGLSSPSATDDRQHDQLLDLETISAIRFTMHCFSRTMYIYPRRGARVPSGTWRARDVMTRDFILIPPGCSVEKALKSTAPTDSQCFLVGSEWILLGSCHTRGARASTSV